MSAKDSDKHQWTDPKDYGLPYVEITPIQSKASSMDKTPHEPLAEPQTFAKVEAETVIPVFSEPTNGNSEVLKKSEEVAPSKVSDPVLIKPVSEKKSSSWVWAVVLIGVGIVAVIVWQIQSNMNSGNPEPVFEILEEPTNETLPTRVDPTPESTPTEQNQGIVNQDSIRSINNSNPNIPKPAETGTTIANIPSGTLIRVESKAERPQYFIIVGSLPNEKLATEEANQYFGRSSEIYLITPFDGGSNYRLAIAKFGSFRLAAEELERIKSQYTEALWILKY